MIDFVSVAQMHSVKAAIVAGALEAEGLTVRVDRPGFGAIYGLESGDFGTKVMVPVDQEQQARELLAEIEQDLG